MKKTLLLIPIFAFLANNVNAQLSVYSNGHVGVATSSSSTPISSFSVKGGKAGYEASVLGTKRGIYGESNGQYLNWSHGVYGISYSSSTSLQNGVSGVAFIQSPQNSCRTYGVMGIAGNATNGWNYGVFGQLNGTNDGAGVYGTATSGENGSCVDGRYAGYFNGRTKVNGNLTVTGSIFGILLSPVTQPIVSNLSYKNESVSITDKLSKLSATCYYAEATEQQADFMENVLDTMSTITPVNEIQALSADRIHYGLNIEQLKESFPELVYEQEDGTSGINYMEMIPILVQAINDLCTEVKALKAKASHLETSLSSTTAVILSADGKAIGTKRSIAN